MSLDSSDPSDIANASRCFASCVPMGEQQALRTYLLTQLGNAATPPCVTPTAPTSAGAKSIGNTTILMSWSQPPNAGSFIKNYIVYWGTVSGVYTNNSGLLPAMPRLYTISGLATGTAYFWVVQAVAFSGCNSAVSSEKSATTTGAPPIVLNGLLTGLSAFWPLNEVAAGNKADLSVNGLTLTDSDNNIAGTVSGSPPSNIGTWADFTVVDAAKRLIRANTALLQSGTAFTMQCWFQPRATVANAGLMSKWNGTTFEYVLWTNNGTIQFNSKDSGGNTIVVVGAPGGIQGDPLALNTTYHLVVGFDGVNQWIQVNAGARGTINVTTPPLVSNTVNFAIGNYSAGTNIPVNGFIGHCAFWKRSLSTSDVTTLYNAGNPLPFANWTV